MAARLIGKRPLTATERQRRWREKKAYEAGAINMPSDDMIAIVI